MGRELLHAIPVFFLDVSAALTIQTGSPDALCPSEAEARAAVAGRLGTLRVERAGWRARYTNGHTPDSPNGDFIRLEVFDPDGVVRLQRDLPMTGQSCSDMAQALAMVLERYYGALAAGAPKSGEQSTSPAPGRDSLPPARPAGAVPRAPEPRAERPPLSRPGPTRRASLLQVTTGLAIASRPSSAGLALELATRPWQRIEFGLGGLALFSRAKQQVAEGTVSLRGFPLRAWVTYAVARGGLDVHLGPELLGAIDLGQTADGADTKPRFLFGLGGRLSVRSWPTPRVGFGLSGGLDLPFRALSGQFMVGEREVLSPGPAEGFVAINAIWVLVP